MITEHDLFAQASRQNASLETIAVNAGVSVAEVQAICWRLADAEITRAYVVRVGGLSEFKGRRAYRLVYRIAGVPVRPGQKHTRQKAIADLYVKGYDYHEIAAKFGIKYGDVATSMHRFRKRATATS